jgi:hypothetical protein
MMGWFSALIESRTLRGWAIFAILGAIATAMLVALTGPSLAASEDTDDADVTIAELQEKTAKYQDVDRALKDGYVAPTRADGSLICVPGMGYHFVNRSDVLDEDPPEVGIKGHPLKPEAMLYERGENGELKLIAVEWIVRYEGQATPVLPGQPDAQFAGPMARHEPWMPTHYDLHAYIWKTNPSGTFAQFNTAVTCPS